MKLKLATKVTLMAAFFLLSAFRLAADTYSLAGDFSIASNPNGVWTYGSVAALGSAFSPDAFVESGACDGNAMQGWRGTPGGVPVVLKNTTGGTATCGSTVSVPAGQADLHPGADNSYSVVRFTALYDDFFTIIGYFEGADIAPTTTDEHIRMNGTDLVSFGIASFHSPMSFDLGVRLHSGDTIDFAVGTGGNGFSNDSTILSATIAGSPEPATVVTVLGGLLVIGGTRRRAASRFRI